MCMCSVCLDTIGTDRALRGIGDTHAPVLPSPSRAGSETGDGNQQGDTGGYLTPHALPQKHRRGQSVRGGGEMHETDAARALRMFASIGS
jgi:hypothetical protein